MLTIGEFARICFVSKKTLRHYDEIGLLRPEHVADNGYRYYTTDQLRTMLLINRLKSYGFSLPEIGAVLASPGEDLLAAKLAEKHRKMELELQQTTHVLQQMEQDMHKLKRRMDIMEYHFDVKTITLEPQTLYGVRKKIDVKNFQELFGQLFMDISQKNLEPLGPPMAFYFDDDFSPNLCDVEVAVPVAPGTPEAHPMAGGLHCFTTLAGPYLPEQFTAAYAYLVKWAEDNGYHISGAPYDKYVRGGEDYPPEEYLTEIYFPIAK